MWAYRYPDPKNNIDIWTTTFCPKFEPSTSATCKVEAAKQHNEVLAYLNLKLTIYRSRQKFYIYPIYDKAHAIAPPIKTIERPTLI